jgi:hypothetical protein
MNYSVEVLEKAKMAVEIGQAILDGRKIEFKNGKFNIWNETNCPLLDFSMSNYRVKPETKYIPFTFEDAKDLIELNIKTTVKIDHEFYELKFQGVEVVRHNHRFVYKGEFNKTPDHIKYLINSDIVVSVEKEIINYEPA